MGKLWGTNGEAQRESTASDDRPHSRSPFGERADPDEHTALLRDSRSRRLDPSDPAVSPYNLLSVRSLRWISIVLLVAALIWWILLLVSMFTTIPGFHTRGGGWFSFAFVALSNSAEGRTDKMLQLFDFGCRYPLDIVAVLRHPVEVRAHHPARGFILPLHRHHHDPRGLPDPQRRKLGRYRVRRLVFGDYRVGCVLYPVHSYRESSW